MFMMMMMMRGQGFKSRPLHCRVQPAGASYSRTSDCH